MMVNNETNCQLYNYWFPYGTCIVDINEALIDKKNLKCTTEIWFFPRLNLIHLTRQVSFSVFLMNKLPTGRKYNPESDGCPTTRKRVMHTNHVDVFDIYNANK